MAFTFTTSFFWNFRWSLLLSRVLCNTPTQKKKRPWIFSVFFFESKSELQRKDITQEEEEVVFLLAAGVAYRSPYYKKRAIFVFFSRAHQAISFALSDFFFGIVLQHPPETHRNKSLRCEKKNFFFFFYSIFSHIMLKKEEEEE